MMIATFRPAAKPYKCADSRGLSLLITPTGSKLWRFAYRFGGKQKSLSCGDYPYVSLRVARAWRDAMKRQLAAGVDPSEERRKQKRGGRCVIVLRSFEEAARAWIETRKPAWSPRYEAFITGRLEADIFPAIGKLEISAITLQEMRETLLKIHARGATETARRIQGHCSDIFRFSIAEGHCDENPCEDVMLPKPGPVQHRARVTVEELPAFFTKLNADRSARMSHLALRWTMLTMVRSRETCFATWSELANLDDANPLWRIPYTRMKTRDEHLVPLSRQALRLLEELHSLKSADDRNPKGYLFPMTDSKTQTVTGNHMLDVLYRMGLRGMVTVHGFRGLASTVLNETGMFRGDWIEYQLAHRPEGMGRRYNPAQYLMQRRPMMQWWADYLDAAEAGRMTERLIDGGEPRFAA